ncbi:TPA: hypothetical protein QH405_003970 [Klebsiella michiganensis]|nr:hypothetical protein [Klebsiella michiganensis]
MAKKERTVVELDGDVSGLNKAIGEAEKKLDGFSKHAGGKLGGLASDLSGGLGTLSKGLVGVAALSLSAATAIGGLVLKVNSVVRELNQLSKQTGLTVEDLQKLEKQFRSTGLGSEKLADINQDTLDKLGDAYRNGGGIADDMISVGLDPTKYEKFLNDPRGGIKAVIQAYYDLKNAGASVADQKFLLESFASDASRLTGVLDNAKDSQDAWNKIQEQSVSITNEQAAEYAKFDRNLSNLTDTGKTYLFEMLNPIVESTNNLADAMRNVNSTNFLVDIVQTASELQIKINSLTHMFPGLSTAMGLISDAADSFREDVPTKPLPQLTGNLPTTPATVIKPSKGWVDKNKEKAEAERAAKAAQREADAKAKKAAADAKRASDERIKAQKDLNTILAEITVGESERQFAIFARQQNDITTKIQENSKVLKLSQKELDGYLNKQREYAVYQRNQMTNQMIGYSDPNAQLKTNIGLLQSGSLNSTQKGFLADQQAQGLGENPDKQRQLDQNNQAMQLELQQNELLLKGHEDYEKRKAQITAKYAQQAVAIQNQETTQLLQGMESSFGQIGDGMAAAFGESSTAAQAAFAVQKGVTISMTILKIQEALASALALGFPQNIPAYAQIAAMGMSIISTAKGINAGQFHGGIDELPSSYDNKSFMLKAGERVVQPEANKKLTSFLDEQEKSGSSGDVTVNAPLYVYGSGNDKDFQEKLKKHQNSIVQAVRDSQRRNS